MIFEMLAKIGKQTAVTSTEVPHFRKPLIFNTSASKEKQTKCLQTSQVFHDGMDITKN
jgi:hypothetical protein